MKSSLLLFAILLVTVSTLSGQRGSTKSQTLQNNTQINGQVRFANGSGGPQNVQIVLEGGGGYIDQTSTGPEGKFAFRGIGSGMFTVRARYPGYQEVSQQVDLQSVVTAYVQIVLKPLPNADGKLPPEGPNAAVSAIPEDARKEFERGNAQLMEKKDAKGSVPFFQKAIKAYPSFAEAYFLMGTAYLDQQKWKEAQDALQKAIGLNEGIAGAHLGIGSSLIGQGKFAEAEKPLRKGLELDDKSAQGHYELGRVLSALNRWPEVEPEARKAVELNPDLAQAHILLGNALLHKRANAEALEQFKEYLRLDPKGPLAVPTQELVKKIETALKPK